MMANNNINMNLDQHVQINPVPQGPPMIRGEPVHPCLAAQFNNAVACATANPGAKDMLEDLFHKLNFFVGKMASMGDGFFRTFTDFAYTIPQGLLQPANQLSAIPEYLAQLAAQISVLKVQFLTQAKKVDRRAANTVPNKIAELKQQQAVDLQHCERLVEAMSARRDQIKLLSAADETLKYMISLENPIQSVGFSRDRATNLLTAAFTNSLLPPNADEGIAEITAAMGRSAFDGSGSMSMVPFRGGRGPMNH